MAVELIRSTEQQRTRAAVGRRMAARRGASGLTCEQLAARAAISPDVVSRLEQGEAIAVIPTFLLVAALHRLHVDDRSLQADAVVLGQLRAGELELEATRRRRRRM